MSNYDETYGVISEVIMRKFRASMEPFWDLNFSEICRVSCVCILTSSVLPSLTSSDGRTSRVLYADVIPWI